MIKQMDYHVFPEDLNAAITSICSDMKTILEAVADVVHIDGSDAAEQLKDVLKSSDNAANIIIDCAVAIYAAIQRSDAPRECMQEISKNIIHIYEACNFQDLATQRIKKVLHELGLLQTRLSQLNKTVKDYTIVSEVKKEPTTNSDGPTLVGPQLSSIAPSQDDVDLILSTH